MEWDTPPRAGQRPRTAQIPSVSGILTSYQLAMVFDTPPKSGRAPIGVSFQERRPVGRSVFIPSPTKAITRCEQQTLPKTANTIPAHAPETIQSVLAAPKGAGCVQTPWDTPPSKEAQRMRKRHIVHTNMPPPERHSGTNMMTVAPYWCQRNNSWSPRWPTLLWPLARLCAFLPVLVHQTLLSVLVE